MLPQCFLHHGMFCAKQWEYMTYLHLKMWQDMILIEPVSILIDPINIDPFGDPGFDFPAEQQSMMMLPAEWLE